ncbi:ABC transporter permease subunit [Microbacterium sp. NPDC056052]|uniref:ABC transporter permease subunit n=1 Tax=Microbacterium sp. NPDC056052 TaxID=3345695 RepID=UPI0035D8AC70
MSAVAPTVPAVSGPFRLSFPRSLRSEWIKLTTLRSTWWSIAITAALTIGIAVLIAFAMSSSAGPQAGALNGIMAVVMPIQFTALLAGILGAIAVTGEYSTGMIRSTLTADPRRGRVLVAKAVVLALFLFLASLAMFVIAAVIVSAILGGHGQALEWGAPDKVLLPLLSAAATMAVCALIGVSFGFLLRSGAGAIAATVGLLFVLPIMSNFFAFAGESWKWVLDAANYLPLSAAQNAILPSDTSSLSGGVAFLTLGAWVAAGLLGSWVVLRSRDA